VRVHRPPGAEIGYAGGALEGAAPASVHQRNGSGRAGRDDLVEMWPQHGPVGLGRRGGRDEQHREGERRRHPAENACRCHEESVGRPGLSVIGWETDPWVRPGWQTGGGLSPTFGGETKRRDPASKGQIAALCSGSRPETVGEVDTA
jgi:hypothetical protein